MSERYDDRDAEWPLRPWIMAAICAVAGLLFENLSDMNTNDNVSAVRQAAAAFVVVSAISFVITVEQRRWQWALAFALAWGAIVALVGWFTASYNQHREIFEFPFLSGLFAVLLAAPLFQTARDEGRWRFPYPRLHAYAWTDAVIGAASLAFVGVSFLLAWLIGGMFDLIGIDFIIDLLKEGWFGWMLAGFAFGAAVGLLRERDALAATLQRLVMVVLGVLAPVLALALTLFLLSLPFTGLGKLWAASVPSTPLMLVAGAGAILLANAVIGNGTDHRVTSQILRRSAMVLVLAVLPLAVIAAISLSLRIGQYGWTPERIWGLVAVGVAVTYGLVGWLAVFRGRADYDDVLRPLQTKLALGICGLALLLSLPILDFGAISARSQVDRLATGRTAPADFDWQAMAFDFGPAGRARLHDMARTGAPDQRRLASSALAATERHMVEEQVRKADSAVTLATRLRIIPAGAILPSGLRESIAATRYCRVGPCVVTLVDQGRAVIAGALIKDETVESALLMPNAKGAWQQDIHSRYIAKPPFRPDMARAPVELRTVARRQLYIDGRPVGDAFE